MAFIEKVNSTKYTLGTPISISGNVLLCKSKDDPKLNLVVKKISTKKTLVEEISEQGDKFRISLNSLYVLLPNAYWEDQKEQCVYVVMNRMTKSLQEMISENKRKGVFIPILLVKRCVEDSVQGLRMIHTKKFYHGHVKPTNILYNEDDDEYNLSDLGVFGQEKQDDYQSPELTQSMIKQQNQKFQQNAASQLDDNQRNDVWQLGMSFLEMATLQKAADFAIFKDANQVDSTKAIRQKISARYGKSFLLLLEQMLQINPAKRKRVILELDEYMKEFKEEDHKNLVEEKVLPDAGLIIHEMKTRLAQMKENIQDYFIKYEMHPRTCLLRTQMFFRGLVELNLDLSTQEQLAVEQLLDPKDSGYIDLSKQVREDQTQGVKMLDLKGEDVKKLKAILTEMNDYIMEKDIDIENLLASADIQGKRYLDVLLFTQTLATRNLIIYDEEINLIKARYDPNRKGVIYYDFFCQDIKGTSQGKSQGLGTILENIYNTIRSKFVTFQAFFKKYDTASRGFLKQDELQTFFTNYSISPAQVVMKGLLEKFDPDNRQQLLYQNIRDTFQSMIDAELKHLLTQIAKNLSEQRLNFITLTQSIQRNNQSNRVISQDKLYDAFRSVNIDMKRPDLNFFLNVLNADKNDEINIHDLNEALKSASKYLKINTFDVYIDDEMKNSTKRPDHLDRNDSKKNLLPDNNKSNYALYQASIFHYSQINYSLKMKNKDFNIFSQIDKHREGTIRTRDLEQVMREDLKINTNNPKYQKFQKFLDPREEQHVSLNQLRKGLEDDEKAERLIINMKKNINQGRQDPQRLFSQYDKFQNEKFDLSQFKTFTQDFVDRDTEQNIIEILFAKLDENCEQFILVSGFKQILLEQKINQGQDQTYQQNQKSQDTSNYQNKPYNQLYASVIYFQMINIAMSKRNKTVSIFNQLDKYKEGTIRVRDFDMIFQDELGLSTNDSKYLKFQNNIKDVSDDKIQLSKLKQGLEDDSKADRLLQTFNRDITQGHLDIKRLFSKYDQNQNQKLELNEFKNLIQDVVERGTEQNTLDALFVKLDTNGDQAISVKEIQSILSGNQNNSESQKFPYQPQKYDEPQNKNEIQNYPQINACVFYFQTINQSMTKNRQDFNIFSQFDKRGEGTMRNRDFEKVLQDELGIYTNNPKYQKFISFIQHHSDDQFITLGKVRKGLEDDVQAERALIDLQNDVQQGRLKPDRFFANYDKNKNIKIELFEFKQLLTNSSGLSIDQRIIDVLFAKLDTNCEQSISIRDFRELINTDNRYDQQQQPQQRQNYDDQYKQPQQRQNYDDQYKQPQQRQNYDDQYKQPQQKQNYEGIKADNKYDQQGSFQNYSQQHASVTYCSIIGVAMDKKNRDFTIFTQFDKYKDGAIHIKDFEKVLHDDLGVNINDSMYQKFQKSMQKVSDDKTIQLDKLRKGLDEDKKAESVLQMLNREVSQGRLDSKRLFAKYDKNQNERLELNEFKNLIHDCVERGTEQITLEVLFAQLDTNGDQSISVKEFYNKLTTNPKDLQTKQPLKSQYGDLPIPLKKNNAGVYRAAGEIQLALKRENLELNIFDPRDKKVCLISKFNNIITDELGMQSNNINVKALITYLQEDIDSQQLEIPKLMRLFEEQEAAQQLLQKLIQIVQSGTRVEDFFEDYDANDDKLLALPEFTKLIRDMDGSARQKTIETLFCTMDENGDNSIELKEFKHQVQIKRSLSSNQNKFDKPLSGKQNPLDSDDILDLMAKSQYLAKALEELDHDDSNTLSVQQMQSAFKSAHGHNVETEDLKQAAIQLGAFSGNKINYKKMVKLARDKNSMTQSTGQGSKLQKICEKIKQDLQYKDIDLLKTFKVYDNDGSGRISEKAIISEMNDKGLKISQDDFDLLFSLAQPDDKKKIDYQELNRLIMEGPEALKRGSKKNVSFDSKNQKYGNYDQNDNTNNKYKGRSNISRTDIDQAYGFVMDSCIHYMERMNFSLIMFYKNCDSNGNGVITLNEFQRYLQGALQIKLNHDDLFEGVFDLIDLDGDGKINFKDLQGAVYGKNIINPQHILSAKQTFLGNRDIRDDRQMQQLFQNITNNQEFSYQEFCKFTRQFVPQISIIELDQMFIYFDRTYQERVSFNTFLQVMREPSNGGQLQNNSNQNYNQNMGQPAQTPRNNQNISYNQQQANVQQYHENQLDHDYQQQQNNQQKMNQGIQNNNNPNIQIIDQGYSIYNNEGIQQNNNQGNSQQNFKNPAQNNIQQNQLNILNNNLNIQQQNNQYGQSNHDQQVGNPMNFKDDRLPQQFDRQYYEEQLKSRSNSAQIDLFDFLCQFDRTEHPDFVISSTQEFQRLFEILGIKISNDDIKQFYNYYSRNTQYLSYSQLYLRISSPGKLVAKALNLAIIKHKYQTQYLWDTIGSKQQFWNLKQFQNINESLKLNLIQQELEQAFQFWDRSGTQKINYQSFCDILQSTAIKSIAQNGQSGMPTTTNRTQQDILNEFLNVLSSQVLSKRCFNLFEMMDTKRIGMISVADFERTTSQIMSDAQPNELMAVKQLMSRDGLINLSDLAHALKIGNENAGGQGNQFNTQQDKMQFGINQRGPQQQQKMPSQVQFTAIMTLIQGYLTKNKKTYDDMAAIYFANNSGTVDKNFFIQKTNDFSMGLTAAQCQDLFVYLDINQSGQISVNEFRMVFPTQGKTIIKNIENVTMSKDLEDEISELFKVIDVDKNNFIDQKELQKALVSIGISPSVEDLQQYFRVFDKNNDGTITQDEFSIILKDVVKREMLHADDLLEELRKEFRAVCNPISRQLSKEQMKQVFAKLGVVIQADEMNTLFSEIDEDKSNSIDIDEFIYFIQKNQSGLSAKASAAVMNIKGARRISLHDLRDIFMSMPSNFIMSFIAQQNKQLMNLTAAPLKPKLDQSGLFYQDLNYVEHSAFNLKSSVLDRSTAKSNILLEITLIGATGIPMPADNEQGKGDQFLQREVGFLLYDRAKNKFEGNAAFVKAQWKQEYTDRWSFEGPVQENSVLLRWGTFDERLDASTDLVIEMITYINKKGRLIQISCSYASIALINLKPGKQYLDLKGGQPTKELLIDQKDIRTNRTGWRSVVKSLSSAIKSQIQIDVIRPQVVVQVQQMLALPNKFILNRWALPLWKGFREYYAFRTVCKGELELNLSSDTRIKAWLQAINCPETYRPLANFWTEFLEPRCINHQFQLDAAKAIGDQFYLLFVNSDFKYNSGDPSKRIYNDGVLTKKRMDLIQDAIQDLKFSTGVAPPNQQQRKPVNYYNMDPINMLEHMENNDEEEMAAIDKFLLKKQKRLSKN